MLKPEINEYLVQAAPVFNYLDGTELQPLSHPPVGDLHVGVDLGTVTLTLAELDQDLHPVAGEYL